jgi:hypothetical protein
LLLEFAPERLLLQLREGPEPARRCEKMAEQISRRMPEIIRRVAKGEYEVKGTALRIVQGDQGKWTVAGHSDDLVGRQS